MGLADKKSKLDQRPSRLLNAFSNWGTLGIEAILAFILTPIVIHFLGQSGYGIWVLIGSIIGYYGFLDLGISTAVMRYVARFAGQADHRAMNATVSTALALFFVIGFIIVIGTYFCAELLAGLVEVPLGKSNDFIQAIQLLSLAVAIRLVGSTFSISLMAHEMFVASNIITIIGTLARAAGTLWFLSNDWGLLGIALSHTLAAGLMGLLHFIVCMRYIPSLSIKINKINKSTLNNLITFGGVTTVIAITDTIRLNLDSIVIAKFVDMASVGVFGIAAILVRYFVHLVVAAMGVLTPRFAALHGLNEQHELSGLFLKSLFVCSLMAFSFGAMLIAFGGSFIHLWVGDDFKPAIPVLYVLVIGHTVAVSQNVGIGMMYALKKHHWYAITSTVEAILNLTLSIILVLHYGIIGVALGTVIPMLLIRAIIQPIYVSHLMKIHVATYYAYLVPGALIGVSIVTLVAFIGSKTFLDQSYLTLAIQAIIASLGSVIFLVLAYRYSQKIELIGPWKKEMRVVTNEKNA